MAVKVEVYENKDNRGTFDFEVAPRAGERVEIQGMKGVWRVVEVRHLVVKGAPAQLQIAIQAATD